MDRETIIKLAREAAAKQGHTPEGNPQKETVEFLGNFANLVAEHSASVEREACAQVCEDIGEESDAFTRHILRSTAAAIRARGNT
jgi:hypothetical protein